MTLTKAEIAEGLQQGFALPKLVAKEIVDQVFEEIRVNLEVGKSLKLTGLGRFELRDKKARPGRNPKTGEPKVIKARRVVTFKAGQKLKARIEKIVAPDKSKK
jgi:integration host factor subunit alpha